MTVGVLVSGFTGPHADDHIAPLANAHRLRTYLADHGETIQVIQHAAHWMPQELGYFLEKLPSLRFVGFSITFDRSIAHLRPLMRHIRKTMPHVQIIIGGPETPLCIKSDADLIDRVFVGHSEHALLRYVRHLAGGPDLEWSIGRMGIPFVISDERYPLSKEDVLDLRIDWQASDHIDSHMTLPLEISRGCAFRCRFCSYPLMGKTRFDYVRSEESITAELRRNHELFGTTRYWFLDDTFNDSQYKLDLVQRAIRASGVPVRFATYLRHDLMAAFPKTIEQLSEMGLLAATFGVESLNEKVRRLIGKGGKTKESLDAIAALKASRRDLWTSSGFIVGLPGETRDMLNASQKFLMDNANRYFDSWYWQPLWINKNADRLTTEFGRDAEKFGYRFPKNGFEWETDIMTRAAAVEIATQFGREAQSLLRLTNPMVMTTLSFLPMSALVGRSRLEIGAMLDIKTAVQKRIRDYKRKMLK